MPPSCCYVAFDWGSWLQALEMCPLENAAHLSGTSCSRTAGFKRAAEATRTGSRLHFRSKQQKLHLFLMYICSAVCWCCCDAWIEVLRDNEPRDDRWQEVQALRAEQQRQVKRKQRETQWGKEKGKAKRNHMRKRNMGEKVRGEQEKQPWGHQREWVK